MSSSSRAAGVRRDVRDLRDGPPRGAPSTPVMPVVDTAEVRWFTTGHVPEDVVAWFTHDGATGQFEERRDTYLIDGRTDVGVKRRFGRTLELKRRIAPSAALVLTTDLTGGVEGWRRWSPADGLVERTDRESWVEVAKAVVKRRFSPAGEERQVSPQLPPDGGCDAELAAITVGAVQAWSFALAGFGPPSVRHRAISVAWGALVAGSSCPPGFESSFESSSGYPDWLDQLASRGLLVPVADLSGRSTT